MREPKYSIGQEFFNDEELVKIITINYDKHRSFVDYGVGGAMKNDIRRATEEEIDGWLTQK